ncbi:S-layer-related duplication domain protein [Methanomethylovorans hollandica DSM 15978]|uniref:S-layer-related duplication domain protein n=1 Tax=Methanomethylovorans hollandica (strain DSM 15978 / NBRC 107637 / DMS1) TaxID=867904 RepID=L0KXW5_METHD|nr:S-layer protein domain-containing protein [Methanomethylovorans hollandica]AGB49966.1 S-layer-related duplication domain protein [Methanomethylovorans hollandica DSM 15978]
MKIKIFIVTLLCLGLLSTTALAANNSTGNRIWDAAQEPALEYTWSPLSYSGFYYDLDSGEGSETLTVKLDSYSDRSIEENDLTYSTRPIETGFERSEWGSFQIIGFMAERYFAGYSGNTDFTRDVSLIADGQLAKVLINEDDEKSLFTGSSLILEEGYVLDITEIDLNGNKVFVTLKKNGVQVDSTVIASNQDYIYKTRVGSTDDFPLIVVHLENIFRGTETNAVFVRGVFQVSDEYISVQGSDNYGRMRVRTVSDAQITMSNPDVINLNAGKTINIMGKLNFVVADDRVLRFAPVVDMTEPGTYELRGTVADGPFNWTALNFEGFYYNIDEGIGTESLKATALRGRTIPTGNLVYSTTAQQVSFDHSAWGKFEVIGFLAHKYFAGYPDNAFTSSVSMVSQGQLSKVLIDNDDKKSASPGSSLVLEEGYVLDVVEVDLNGNRVLVSLTQNGQEVDTGILSSNTDYVYKTDIGSSDDVPQIVVHFDQIFQGREFDAIFVQGIFQVSEDYITLEGSDRFGRMEVSGISENGITLRNRNSISLTKDTVISVMDDISIKVADSDTLRYYPFVLTTTSSTQQLSIEMPETIIAGTAVDIKVTSQGAAVEGAVVKLNNVQRGTTSNEGILSVTLGETGTFKVTAEKEGSVTGALDVEVISADDATRKMEIEINPETVFAGDGITISVKKAIGGEPVRGGALFYDGTAIGNTSAEGMLTYTPRDAGIHKIRVEADDLLPAEITFEVEAAENMFTYSDLIIEPASVEQGKEATVSVNVANTGTSAGEVRVELLVNNNVTDAQNVSLTAGEEKTVKFTATADQPGTVDVQIGNQQGSFDVTQKTPFVGIVAAIAIVAMVAVFRNRRNKE